MCAFHSFQHQKFPVSPPYTGGVETSGKVSESFLKVSILPVCFFRFFFIQFNTLMDFSIRGEFPKVSWKVSFIEFPKFPESFHKSFPRKLVENGGG